MASTNSSDTTEVTTDATPSHELDRNNNEPNKKTSATPVCKSKHSSKRVKNEEAINLIKTMHEENKRAEERRFEREMAFYDSLQAEMAFYDSLQAEMAKQHMERMKETYALIGALKNNN